jgi:hypothetical protein
MNSVRNAADGTLYTEYDYSGGGTSTPVDEYQYGYDEFGNVAWKENVVANNQGAGLDELFTYAWNRLVAVGAVGDTSGNVAVTYQYDGLGRKTMMPVTGSASWGLRMSPCGKWVW